MDSSGQPDKSLGSGLSLPQWMRNKMDTRFDFNDSAFSPPSHDDNFFYIRYPKTQDPKPTEDGFRPISEIFSQSKNMAAPPVASSQLPPPNFEAVAEIDFSKHPLPCQPFVPHSTQKFMENRPPKSAYAGKVKSLGTDDGFHGKPALCGKSIVHVANQIMSGKTVKGFTLEVNQNQESDKVANKGSKSLPATPLTSPMSTPDSSPKTRRKVHSNRYFTGTFVPDKEKYQGGWILASLLGQQREVVSNKIEEEDELNVEVVTSKNLTRKKSISSQNLTYIPPKDEESTSNRNIYTKVFQAKPSELREMNFWSPTSM